MKTQHAKHARRLGILLYIFWGLAGLGTVVAAEPYLVKDINPISEPFQGPRHLTDMNGTLFFTAYDGIVGRELWKSDGTAAGTVLVKDIHSSTISYGGPYALTNFNGMLYFGADDGSDPALWKSDGTEAGTVKVGGTTQANDGHPFSNFVNVNGTLYFRGGGFNSSNRELWKSDGTSDGTMQVKDINPAGHSDPIGFTGVNGTVFFSATDGSSGIELWKSDGTAVGTVLVKDINPVGDSDPVAISLTNVNGTLFFAATDGSLGYELWKSDGTAAGTVVVKDINPVGGSGPFHLTNVNGTLFFAATDGSSGYELWKSDGTAAGTVLVKDINPAGDSIPSNFTSSSDQITNVNGTLFFTATDGTGRELWKSDGTAAGTVLVKDINPVGSSTPNNFINVDGTLYFFADDGTGRELWKSDGTAAGTVRVSDNIPTGRSNPSVLTYADGTLFFVLNDGSTGYELWALFPDTTSVADLALAMTAPASVLPSQTVEYTLTVTNNGPDQATNVRVTGSLPTCAFASIVAGGTTTCTASVIATDVGTLVQSMSVSSSSQDPDATNNSASVSTTVLPAADLAVVITASPNPVKKGAKLVYELTISNAGPEVANNVVLDVVLPVDIQFEKLTTRDASCTGEGPVACVIDVLDAGATATVSITIKPMATGIATATADVSADESDPDTTNNTASVDTEVTKGGKGRR